MAAARSPLRRWERFFPAFAAIDDAIEAATGHPRGEFRSVRARIAGLLRGAENDDGVAEELCAALDTVMEEALATLRVVAAASAPPESTGLAEAVVALSDHHESPRVRGLAGDVVRRWMAAAEAALVGAIRFVEVVKSSKRANEPQLTLRESASSIAAERARGCDAHVAANEDKERHAPLTKTKMSIEPANSSVAVKVAAPTTLNKKAAKGKMEENTEAKTKTPGAGGGNRVQTQREEMMEATKRKLREGYQQVEDAKRQRKIQVIEAPKMLEQRQKKKMHPILRERSRARCGSSLGVRRSLLPSHQKI